MNSSRSNCGSAARWKSVLLAAAMIPLALCATGAQAASLVYDSFLHDVFTGNIVSTDTFKCELTTSSYTPAKATHTRRSDVTNEVTGTGYTAGGQTVTPTFVLDTTNHKEVITFPSVTWSAATITARSMVCFKSVGTAATDRLVLYVDLGGDITSTGGNFTISQSVINFNIP